MRSTQTSLSFNRNVFLIGNVGNREPSKSPAAGYKGQNEEKGLLGMLVEHKEGATWVSFKSTQALMLSRIPVATGSLILSPFWRRELTHY